eukprot:3763262-Rhodomonas_salina.6
MSPGSLCQYWTAHSFTGPPYTRSVPGIAYTAKSKTLCAGSGLHLLRPNLLGSAPPGSSIVYISTGLRIANA